MWRQASQPGPARASPGGAQCGHKRRTNRCDTTPLSDSRKVAGSTSMYRKRSITLNASLACTDDSTRWPVNADCTAMAAVSASRISPTRMVSGSWRKMDRRPRAKVRPFFSFTGICRMPLISYSTGSSMVISFSSPLFSSDKAPYKVVDLPLPVGPVISVRP
ncbi:hypothetical protein D3C87_1605710 [compost metagenome]